MSNLTELKALEGYLTSAGKMVRELLETDSKILRRISGYPADIQDVLPAVEEAVEKIDGVYFKLCELKGKGLGQRIGKKDVGRIQDSRGHPKGRRNDVFATYEVRVLIPRQHDDGLADEQSEVLQELDLESALYRAVRAQLDSRTALDKASVVVGPIEEEGR